MQEMTYGIPQRIPSLVSLSTIAMATGFQYECPSGMFSLLCAMTGSCTLIAADREIRRKRQGLQAGIIGQETDRDICRFIRNSGAFHPE